MQRKQLLRMRFDHLAGGQKATAAATPQMKPLPASMQAKHLDATYTPYPLPKHDPTFEYGPTSIGNIPDIHAARRRTMAEEQQRAKDEAAFLEFEKNPPLPRSFRSTLQQELYERDPSFLARKKKAAAAVMTEEEASEADALFDQMLGEDAMQAVGEERVGGPSSSSQQQQQGEGAEEEEHMGEQAEEDDSAETLADLQRLEEFQRRINEAIAERAKEHRRVAAHLKGKDLPEQYRKRDLGSEHENRHRDVTECLKPIPEILAEFNSTVHYHSKDTRHILTMYDLCSTMHRQSKGELIEVINTVAEAFDVTARTKTQFFRRAHMRGIKGNTQSTVALTYPALVAAYKAFHYALEDELMFEGGEDRLYDVDVLTAVYKLFAHTQYRNPDSWMAADEKRTNGNISTAGSRVTPSLQDFDPTHHVWNGMADAIAGRIGDEDHAAHWLYGASKAQLAGLLSAMVAADPSQRPDGPAIKRILDVYFAKKEDGVEEDMAALGSLCLGCVVGNIVDRRPFMALLRATSGGSQQKSIPPAAIKAIGKANDPKLITALFESVAGDTEGLEAMMNGPLGLEQNPALKAMLTALYTNAAADSDGLDLLTATQLAGERKAFAIAAMVLSSARATEDAFAAAAKALDGLASSTASDAEKAAIEERFIAIDSQRGALCEAVHDALSSVHPPALAVSVAKHINLDSMVLEYIRGFATNFFEGGSAAAEGAAADEDATIDGEDEEEELALTASHARGTWEGIQKDVNPAQLAAGEVLSASSEFIPSAQTSVFGEGEGKLRSPFDYVPNVRTLRGLCVVHSNAVALGTAALMQTLRKANDIGTSAVVVSTSTLIEMHRKSVQSPRRDDRKAFRRALRTLAVEAKRENGTVYVVPCSGEYLLRGTNSKGVLTEDQVVWLTRDELLRVSPTTAVTLLVDQASKASRSMAVNAQQESAGATPISGLNYMVRELVEGGRYYKGGQHVRDSTMYGGYSMAVGGTQGKTIHTGYRPVTDRRAGAQAFYRRRQTLWCGKDGGIRDKVKLSGTERFGYGMLQGSPGADIRNMGLYTPDFPTVDARLAGSADAASTSHTALSPFSERKVQRRKQM